MMSAAWTACILLWYWRMGKPTWNLFIPIILFIDSALLLQPVLLSPRIKSCRYARAALRVFSDLDEDCTDASECCGQWLLGRSWKNKVQLMDLSSSVSFWQSFMLMLSKYKAWHQEKVILIYAWFKRSSSQEGFPELIPFWTKAWSWSQTLQDYSCLHHRCGRRVLSTQSILAPGLGFI